MPLVVPSVSPVLWGGRPQEQVRVALTTVPDSFGRKFMTGGVNLYQEAPAALQFRMERQSEFAYFPWIPVMQDEVVFGLPKVNADTTLDLILHLEPGVVGTLDRTFEW